MKKGVQAVYFIAGVLCLLLALLGITLPLLPTTPFILLASFLFARSSRRCHSWLREHPTFGEIVCSWEDNGVISLRAKRLATMMITLVSSYPLFFGEFSFLLRLSLGAVLISVLAYIWTRPSDISSPITECI